MERVMRKIWMAAGGLTLISSAALADYGVSGNYQGGIIPYSPGVEAVYRQAAAEHCAWYNRVARITSIYRAYGQYISFACVFDRRYDPVKAGVFHWPF
jgi:hypothetical protein